MRVRMRLGEIGDICNIGIRKMILYLASVSATVLHSIKSHLVHTEKNIVTCI